MIFGDELIITRDGIHVSEHSLKTIGIFPGTKVYMQPFRTFEYRETEPGHYYSKDLLITPIHPSMWPFVIRFELRLRNRPGTILRAFEFFRQHNINVLFSECTRSGHHHIALNVLGEHQHLQAISIEKLFREIYEWQNTLFNREAEKENKTYLSWLSMIIGEFCHPRNNSRKKRRDNESWKWNDKKQMKERLQWGDKDHEIFENVAHYLLSEHADKSLEKFLEHEIREAQPLISQIEHDSVEKQQSSHETYQCVEYQTLPVRVVLDAIMIYKNIVCDYLKLRFIQDALMNPMRDQNSLQLFSFYLYNVQHYGGIITNSAFSFNTLRLSKSSTIFGEIIGDIGRRLEKVKNELKRPSDFGTRMDLDPVRISSLEFMSHAYYHRMYARYFISKAQKSFLPFPDLKEHPTDFLNAIIPDRNAATLAIASSNTDDYTMRLCPIPVRALNRFRNIEVTEYARECPDQCSKEWFQKMKDKSVISTEAMPDLDSENGTGISCGGSSVGLVECMLNALQRVNNSNENPQYLLSQWRMFNQLFKITRNHESGAIHFLVEATGSNFFGYSSDGWDQELKERFDANLAQKYSHRHIQIGKVCVTELSGGRVFVSLSFGHPMRGKWMECIMRVGKELGFHDIFTVETFTRPVTDEVALGIKSSHAMLQILALPLAKENDIAESKNENKASKLMWLHAEYLTARTNDLRIVRLVDENSIDTNAIPIGRDHASFMFSVSKPFDEFEKKVREALLHLRRDLADTLGLS